MRLAASLRQRLDARIGSWVQRRQGTDRLPLTIHRRRLYILPTRAGIAFGALLFGMLLAGLNYANNLALFLTFLFAGLVLVSMHWAHRNLLDVQVLAVQPEATFAARPARLELRVGAERGERHDLRADLDDEISEPVALRVEGRAAEAANLSLELPPLSRGVYPLGRVRLSTTHPFGLFRAWTWLHLPMQRVVYPQPRSHSTPRSHAGAESGESERPQPGDDEWRQLRGYQDGDAPRRIAWKAYARGGPLLVKEYAASGSDRRELDFEALAPLPPEARLEQLCRWIVDAEQRGEPYSLRLPGLAIAPDSGPAHRHRCLEALARFST